MHLLLETPKGNLSKIMQPFQTSYTVSFNKRHGRSGHLFEQRYKAFLVDKDNYLLEVSRYLHLNPVAAGIVKRPGDYPWSSYAGYLKGRGIAGLKRERVLDYFSGGMRKQLAEYREFVEGTLPKAKFAALPVLKQAFVGDEDFMEEVRKKAGKDSALERFYPLKRIVQAVCKASDLGEEEVKCSRRSEEIQKAREIICYLARRHSDVGLRELVRFLGVKELSTPSHAVKRAEKRMRKDQDFHRELERILKLLSHSSIQA